MLKHTAFSLFLFMGSHLLNAAGLADRVLILVNDATPPENGTNGLGASVFVGQYYANARGIPTANILHLNTAISEGMEYPVYVNQVESPVRAYLSANNNKMQGQILYIVPAYGVPVSFRYAGGSLAVDSVMAAMLTNPTLGNAAYNPYSLPIGTRPARFDMWSDARPVGNKIFIVSRLDGPNAIIAKGLVDKAIGAETSLTRQSGTGYFDVQGTRVPSEWQYAVDLEMQYASAASAAAGFPTVVNLQRDTGAMIHQAAVNMYDASTRTMGIYPPGTTATLSAPVSAFTEGTATVTFTGIAATTSANTLTFILTTANPSTYVKLLYPLPPFMGYDQTTYMTIQKVVGGATVASNSLLIQSGDAALAALKTLRFDIRNTGIAVVRDNATLIALTDPAAAAMNYTGLTISDKGAYIGVNGLTVTDFAGAVLWNDDFSADSRARYQWSLPGLQGANALWAWGWYGGATDAYRFVNGAIGAQLTSYTANTIRTPVNPDPAVAGIGAQRNWAGACVHAAEASAAPSPRWRRVARPAELVDAREPLPLRPELALDLDGRLLVTLASAGQAVEPERLAPRDRDRVEVAEPPFVRAVQRGADHRHVLGDRDHRGPWLHGPEDARALACPLDEEPESTSVADDLAHGAHGLAVRLAATDGERAERAHELSEAGDAVRLDLRHEVERPRRRDAERGRVDPAEVIRGDDDAALERDASIHSSASLRCRPSIVVM
jgi:uncharacterized protein (TIGR03790 family)